MHDAVPLARPANSLAVSNDLFRFFAVSFSIIYIRSSLIGLR